MTIREPNCTIQWIVIYLKDSVIQLLNFQGLKNKLTQIDKEAENTLLDL